VAVITWPHREGRWGEPPSFPILGRQELSSYFAKNKKQGGSHAHINENCIIRAQGMSYWTGVNTSWWDANKVSLQVESSNGC
jgi:hypothetical protein